MKVILFDGVCNLCNGAVNWVIDHDKQKQFSFSALQSNYGKSIVDKFNITGNYMDTFVLVDGEKFYLRSTAALRVLKELGFPWNLGYAFIIVPPFIRNFVYNWVARNRYSWFGKRDSCRVPTPELKARFLE